MIYGNPGIYKRMCQSCIRRAQACMENDEGYFDISCKLKKYLLNKVI